MPSKYNVDFDNLDRVIINFQKTGYRAEKAINDVLHSYAGTAIEENIRPFMPESGRKPWEGKKKAAKQAKPFKKIKGNLSVTVTTKTPYCYLYFPNDGSNTKRHRGNQQFMYKGVEQAAPDIIEQCTARIIEEIGG